MGKKKNNKSKEKRKQRKEDAQKLAVAGERVKIANDVKDPMDKLMPPFRQYNRQGVNIRIESDKATNFSAEVQEWAFDLTKTNMEALYKPQWVDSDKREELSEEAAWFLVAMTADEEKPRPVAFVHYRFDIDYEDDVLYCYELQVTEEFQRKGLGKFLMQICEMLALQSNMSKVMMTVFHDNKGAQKFYRERLGYVMDDSSPDAFDECDYDILCKPIKSRQQPVSQTQES